MARTHTPLKPRSIVWAAVIDLVAVLVFVLIGRASHGEQLDAGGILTTFWPFAVGLAIGWAAAQAWRHPLRLPLPGVPIWLITLVGGMMFRVLSGQGTALPFVIVATIALAILLIGWRVGAMLVTRGRSVE
ncbi:DUF3054 domain-containing protein [Microbacterium sp. STN6]|uniref:DUF3054 domain-containing protein n=1 Tax=Microbacterium sp. STN6 TaxID=2995588 RepID=UPI002260EF33|nr:DUF3054 domain-containing protein [Microbacterium sp. STN6]MCX7521726.1 DUF3054 domain-containing protein [Microbacterium sp. STN6]